MKWHIRLLKAKIVCLVKGHDWQWRALSVGHMCKRCGKLKPGGWI